MADNVELNAGSGGSTLATDDIAGTHYQIVKVAYGALDSATLAASGAGAVSAGVQRVTLASDDPAVTDLAAIEIATEAIQAAVEGTLTVGSHAVTNAGTFAVQVDGSALTALQLLDDVVYADDADWTDGTSKHALVGGLYQSTPQTVTDGDVAPFNITANGALHVAQQGVIEVDLGANNDVTVTGTVTANLSATDNQVLDNIDADLTTIIGHVDGIEALLGTMDTDTGNIATAVQLIDNASVDHDSSVVAGVTQIGLDARSTDPTAVASGDAVRALATLLGKQVIQPYAQPGALWQYAGPTGGITDTSDDAIQAAGGAGVRHYMTSLTVINAHATVSTEVVIKDGSTVIHRGYAAAGGGGYAITFPTPLRGSAATALNVANITTGAAVHVSASGYSAAE